MTLNTTPGAADADAYISLADARAFHSAQNNTSFAAATDAAAEGAIRRATAWIDQTFRARFVGGRTAGRLQALQWPRTGAVDIDQLVIADNVIPEELIEATAVAALYELAGKILPGISEATRVVKRQELSGLVIEYESSGTTGAAETGPEVITARIETILAPLFRTTSATGASFGLLRS